VLSLNPDDYAYFQASRREGFWDFVQDGKSNLSIPTMYGRRANSGCACRFPGITSGKHRSEHAKRSVATDGTDASSFCFTTHSENLGMYANGTFAGGSLCKNVDVVNMGGDKRSSERLSRADAEAITKCLTPDRSSPDLPAPTLFLLGDSHSAGILPGLALAVRGRYQIRVFRTDIVGVFPHRFNATGTGIAGEWKQPAPDAPLHRFIDYYNQMLRTLKTVVMPGDLVVVMQQAGNWRPGIGAIARTSMGEIYDMDATAMELLERDLLQDVVEPRGAKLVVLGDWPFFMSGGDGNLPIGAPHLQEATVYLQAEMQKSIEPMVANNPNVTYLSLMPLFCRPGTVLSNDATLLPHGTCSWAIPGTNFNAYHNAQHISTAGAIYMWPYMCDAVDKLDGVDEAPAIKGEPLLKRPAREPLPHIPARRAVPASGGHALQPDATAPRWEVGPI
jgi:hypothetical protein